MLKVTGAQRILSLHGGATASRAEAVATALRSADLLPKGGRGPHAPEITPQQASLYALAVAGAERIADSAQVADRLGKLVDEHGYPLLNALADRFGSLAYLQDARHLRVLPAINMAEFCIEGSAGPETTYFAPAEYWRDGFQPDEQQRYYAGFIGHIGGGLMVEMAAHFEGLFD